ncbi:MAG: SufD family Fe-S cluster assembly protein, partial [Chlamydiota bacterium]
ATLKKDARLQSFTLTSGAKSVRHSYGVQLNGENAEAELKGLSMLSGNRTSHAHVKMVHAAERTRSMQKFKTVLSDASQSSFEGKILVHAIAQKTEAYQLNNSLILSPGAVANCKPNLEIFADDVKASHGATISQIDPQQLFYLTTRGIDEKTARELLVQGFCREMTDQLPYPFLTLTR